MRSKYLIRGDETSQPTKDAKNKTRERAARNLSLNVGMGFGLIFASALNISLIGAIACALCFIGISAFQYYLAL